MELWQPRGRIYLARRFWLFMQKSDRSLSLALIYLLFPPRVAELFSPPFTHPDHAQSCRICILIMPEKLVHISSPALTFLDGNNMFCCLKTLSRRDASISITHLVYHLVGAGKCAYSSKSLDDLETKEETLREAPFWHACNRLLKLLRLVCLRGFFGWHKSYDKPLNHLQSKKRF